MKKAQIVSEVARKLKIKEKEALGIVDEIIEQIKLTVAEKGRLEIRDFGVFQVKTRKPRIGRNPRDKREYPIPERKVVTFRAGKLLREKSVDLAAKLSKGNAPS